MSFSNNNNNNNNTTNTNTNTNHTTAAQQQQPQHDATAAAVTRNMHRCREMLQCQEHIKHYQNRFKALRREHEHQQTLAKLQQHAWLTWPTLSKSKRKQPQPQQHRRNHQNKVLLLQERRFQKEYLLAALRSDYLPLELTEPQWYATLPCRRLANDLDLFVARLQRHDFRQYYYYHVYHHAHDDDDDDDCYQYYYNYCSYGDSVSRVEQPNDPSLFLPRLCPQCQSEYSGADSRNEENGEENNKTTTTTTTTKKKHHDSVRPERHAGNSSSSSSSSLSLDNEHHHEEEEAVSYHPHALVVPSEVWLGSNKPVLLQLLQVYPEALIHHFPSLRSSLLDHPHDNNNDNNNNNQGVPNDEEDRFPFGGCWYCGRPLAALSSPSRSHTSHQHSRAHDDQWVWDDADVLRTVCRSLSQSLSSSLPTSSLSLAPVTSQQPRDDDDVENNNNNSNNNNDDRPQAQETNTAWNGIGWNNRRRMHHHHHRPSWYHHHHHHHNDHDEHDHAYDYQNNIYDAAAVAYHSGSWVDLTSRILAHFSERLRSDPALMLECLAIMPGGSARRYLSPCLWSSKDFVLQAVACRMSPTSLADDDDATATATESRRESKAYHEPLVSLQDVSEDLRADRDVVLAFCSLDGRNLQYACQSLRRLYCVIQLACFQHPEALLYAEDARRCRATDKLLRDRQFVLTLLEHGELQSDPATATRVWNCLRRYSGGGKKKKKSHYHHNIIDNDVEIATEAAKIIAPNQAKKLVHRWHENRAFLESVLPVRPWLWLELPTCLQMDRDLAVQSVQQLSRSDIQSGVLHRMIAVRPEFKEVFYHDENVLRAIVQYGERGAIKHVLKQVLPLPKEVCVTLCRCNDYVYELLLPHLDLWEDFDIRQATLEPEVLSDRVLRYMLQQDRYPGLVAQAIEKAASSEVLALDDIFSFVRDDMWSNKSVALAWLNAGGGYLFEEFPEEFEDDPDIFLAVAEHVPDDFYFASHALYGDKEYMQLVLEKNGYLIDEVARWLVNDYDLMLTAFAQCPDLVQSYESVHDSFRRLTKFASKVRSRLDLHNSFVAFLQGISLASSPPCHLRLLDQGKETCMALKRSIASYVGKPRGKELEKLRRASAHLAQWGY